MTCKKIVLFYFFQCVGCIVHKLFSPQVFPVHFLFEINILFCLFVFCSASGEKIVVFRCGLACVIYRTCAGSHCREHVCSVTSSSS